MLFLNFPNGLTFKTFQTHRGFKSILCTSSELAFPLVSLLSVSDLTLPHCACTRLTPNLCVEAPVESVQPHSRILGLGSAKHRISIYVPNHSLPPCPPHTYSLVPLGNEYRTLHRAVPTTELHLRPNYVLNSGNLTLTP